METLINTAYPLAVVLLTWLVLSFIFKTSTSEQRKATTAACGLILGAVWYIWIPDTRLDILIISYLAAIQFYDIIKSYIIKKIDSFYCNDKGLINTEKP